MEHFLLSVLRKVFASAYCANRVRPVAVPMWIIRGIKQRVVQAPTNRVRNCFLAAFNAEKNATAGDILTWELGQIGSLVGAALLHLFVEPVHHVRNPADPRFQVSDAERWKALEYPAND